MKKKVKLAWSKKENDWKFDYPDNAGSSLAQVFFSMIRYRTLSGLYISEQQKEFKKLLEERGYDYTTLKITCEKIKPTGGKI